MNELIAVVDDEKDILELISLHLKKNNFNYRVYDNAKSFINSLQKEIPKLLILDLMLPDMDGIDICKFLRSNEKTKNIFIIMLTAKKDESDKIVGLEIGADDYMTKPFSPKELIARIKAILRRATYVKEEENTKIIDIDGIIKIDLQRFEVRDKNNKKIELTTTEFKILQILSSRRGWVFSREQLLESLWGNEKYVIDRTIDVHIKNLREKLGNAGYLIKNIRGIGYKLEESS